MHSALIQQLPQSQEMRMTMLIKERRRRSHQGNVPASSSASNPSEFPTWAYEPRSFFRFEICKPASNSIQYIDRSCSHDGSFGCPRDIRDCLRQRWQHVLVDEFQDTSKSQLDFIKLLSSTSLLVVGCRSMHLQLVRCPCPKHV
jgi:hypothetical protein